MSLLASEEAATAWPAADCWSADLRSEEAFPLAALLAAAACLEMLKYILGQPAALRKQLWSTAASWEPYPCSTSSVVTLSSEDALSNESMVIKLS